MKQTLQTIALSMLICLGGFASERAYAQEVSAVAADSTRKVPDDYVLSAAYPNPFNPSTSFNLTVGIRQQVTVEVYNMLGQPVRRLFNEVMEAGERRTFTFDAGNLPSGIYLYRVRGETFTAARQITLLK